MKYDFYDMFKGKQYLPLVLFAVLSFACSPEKKAERFIKSLKEKSPSAIVLETNLNSQPPYVIYAQTQPKLMVCKHFLKSKNEDQALVQEGHLIYQTKDSIPRFIYQSHAGQIKTYCSKSGDSLLVPSPIKYITQVFDYQQDSTAWFAYERLDQLFRMKIDSLSSVSCLPDSTTIIKSDSQLVYYMCENVIHRYIIETGDDQITFEGIKAMYPVKTGENTRLVETDENVCYWNLSTDHIDTLLFCRGFGLYGDISISQFEQSNRRLFYTKSQSKYLIGIEIPAQDNETEMCFFVFNPKGSSSFPDYLGSEISEDGYYSYGQKGNDGIIYLCDDYYCTDFDFDGNVIQKRLTVNGYIAENDIHSSMILSYSKHSVSYVKGSIVESYNDLYGNAVQIKRGTVSTSNAGDIEVSISMEHIYPTSDRKRLVIDASNPGFLESGEYLLLFDPDTREYVQIDFGTSVSRDGNRFRVKHIDDTVAYYDQNGYPVSSRFLEDLSDWLFGF